jgi:uncharacterized protein YkwD
MTEHQVQERATRKNTRLLIGAGVLLGVLALFTATLFVRNPDMLASVARSVIIKKTNDNRAVVSEKALVVSPLLERSAQMKAEDMAKRSYFAHVSPEGKTPWYWFDAGGYRFTHAGENLAVRFSDSEAIVRAWMQSEGHRTNMLNGDFTEIGIGIAKGTYKGKDAVYVVQFFGTPAVPESAE